jgi:putative intracellular protease/amidase
MTTRKKILLSASALVVAVSVYSYLVISPFLSQKLKPFPVNHSLSWEQPKHDKTKKTIFIVADNEGTELFDLLAPFYLFNATERTNVYIISGHRAPILLVNSLFILPHYTFTEIDSLSLKPDVIVIPNITVHLEAPPNQKTATWIKKHVTDSTIVLSICDGSATAAATGLYDGKLLTTHASDLEKLQKRFPKPHWVKNFSVTQEGNLYSTAGVSNAVEGSLAVIRRLFGEAAMRGVIQSINYPHSTIQVSHESKIVNTSSIIRAVSKVLLKKNIRMGVLLHDGIDEFSLASILDTYVRSFPSSINTFSANSDGVVSKYGLRLYPTGNLDDKPLNELHVLNTVPAAYNSSLSAANIIKYDRVSSYPINICLDRISSLYGSGFTNSVKLMLDYN